jgi:hypothetical protein
VRLTAILRNLPPDEVRQIARTHLLPEEGPLDPLAQHLARSRTLLNGLKNELRPVTNLIERLAVFGPIADLDSEILGGLAPARLEAAQRKGLLFLLPSAANPRQVVLPTEYALMREIRRPPTTDLISGLRVLGIDHARLVARILKRPETRTTALLLADIHDHLLAEADEIGRQASPGERQILGVLLDRGGVMDAGAFHREFQLVSSQATNGPFPVADLFGLGRTRGRPTDAQRLFQKGLLHAATEKNHPGGTAIQIYIPSELVARLSAAWADRKAAKIDEVRNRAVISAPTEPTRAATADIRAELRAFALAVESLGFGFIRGGEARRDHWF